MLVSVHSGLPLLVTQRKLDILAAWDIGLDQDVTRKGLNDAVTLSGAAAQRWRRQQANRRLVDLQHRHDVEGAQHAVLLLDRHILTRNKGVAVEPKAGLVMAGVAVNIVVDRPNPTSLV